MHWHSIYWTRTPNRLATSRSPSMSRPTHMSTYCSTSAISTGTKGSSSRRPTKIVWKPSALAALRSYKCDASRVYSGVNPKSLCGAQVDLGRRFIGTKLLRTGDGRKRKGCEVLQQRDIAIGQSAGSELAVELL